MERDLEKELESEIIHFSSLIKGLIDANVFKATNSYETDLFVQLNENALNDAFPNVNILLKIYLCMFATNCKGGERSFSKLKLILIFLRNTMGQERLSSLALLAIENDLFRSIDFNDINDQFARQKARRKDI